MRVSKEGLSTIINALESTLTKAEEYGYIQKSGRCSYTHLQSLNMYLKRRLKEYKDGDVISLSAYEILSIRDSVIALLYEVVDVVKILYPKGEE